MDILVVTQVPEDEEPFVEVRSGELVTEKYPNFWIGKDLFQEGIVEQSAINRVYALSADQQSIEIGRR